MAGNGSLPISWYAGISLLCLVPILFFMLFLDETQFALWLPLISLIKALSVPSLLLFIVKSLKEAVRSAAADNFAPLLLIAATLVFILADTVIGIYCFRRSRSVCK